MMSKKLSNYKKPCLPAGRFLLLLTAVLALGFTLFAAAEVQGEVMA